jgi:2-aminoadipate transaminase
VEDDPYSMLRFAGAPQHAVKAHDRAGYVFYLGSFSKMLAPGLRLGWLIAPRELMPKITIIRESLDLESSTLTQRAVYEFLQRGSLTPHLARLNAANAERCAAMLGALDTHFSDIAHWTTPDGGLFVWLTLPASIDTWALAERAIQEAGVAFVPGGAFDVHGGSTHSLRLNFSAVDADSIREGVARLAALMHPLV